MVGYIRLGVTEIYICTRSNCMQLCVPVCVCLCVCFYVKVCVISVVCMFK